MLVQNEYRNEIITKHEGQGERGSLYRLERRPFPSLITRRMSLKYLIFEFRKKRVVPSCDNIISVLSNGRRRMELNLLPPHCVCQTLMFHVVTMLADISGGITLDLYYRFFLENILVLLVLLLFVLLLL